MLCPNDQTTLVMADRQGVEIDYCPTCRGVWLDRGELDKIIDRTPSASVPAPPPTGRSDDRRRDDDRRYDEGYRRRKKKESFLGDLFDF